MDDLPGLDEIALAKLAREMSMNIRPVAQVFKDFGIDETEYYEISKNEFYKKTLEHFLLEWNSSTSTADRLKFQMQAGAEQLMPIVLRRAMDLKEPLASAIEAAKLAAKMGGIGEVKNGDKQVSDRFVISINLGSDTEGKPIIEKFDKSIAIDANDIGGGVIGTGYEKLGPPSDYDIALASLMEKG